MSRRIARISIAICFIAYFASGCTSLRGTATDRSFSEQPSWFSLGGEVYHEHHRHDVQKQVLEFDQQPRWFLAVPRLVDEEEFEDFLESEKKKNEPPGPNVNLLTKPDKDGKYLINARMPYPKNIKEILLVDQGASLCLEIQETNTPSIISFKLTLKASERTIWREVEHRHTNTIPFLFAFFADGKAVTYPWGGFSKFGGVNNLVELVKKGQEYTWNLRVDTRSIDTLLPDSTVRILQVVACFSERQHQSGFWVFDTHFGKAKFMDSQILVRSNTARLERAGDKWVLAK